MRGEVKQNQREATRGNERKRRGEEMSELDDSPSGALRRDDRNSKVRVGRKKRSSLIVLLVETPV